jgi:hypothetical protein
MMAPSGESDGCRMGGPFLCACAPVPLLPCCMAVITTVTKGGSRWQAWSCRPDAASDNELRKVVEYVEGLLARR